MQPFVRRALRHRHIHSLSVLLQHSEVICSVVPVFSASESAALVHDNERRWRVFRSRVQQLAERQREGDVAAEPNCIGKSA